MSVRKNVTRKPVSATTATTSTGEIAREKRTFTAASRSPKLSYPAAPTSISPHPPSSFLLLLCVVRDG